MRWTRREFLTGSSILAVGALGRPSVAAGQAQILAQGQPTPPPTEFRSLRGNVGIFVGQGGTIGWLVSPDAVVVVDAQMPQTAKVCLDGLNARSANRPIACLFNTGYTNRSPTTAPGRTPRSRRTCHLADGLRRELSRAARTADIRPDDLLASIQTSPRSCNSP